MLRSLADAHFASLAINSYISRYENIANIKCRFYTEHKSKFHHIIEHLLEKLNSYPGYVAKADDLGIPEIVVKKLFKNKDALE